jgi:hypothetical protein
VYERSTGKYWYRSSIRIPFPEPIKVYFVSADNQYALMSVWGFNNSATALAFGLMDVRDCRVLEMGAVDVLLLETTPNILQPVVTTRLKQEPMRWE